MPTQKQWTAGDVRMNRMRIYLDSDEVLHVTQGYSFVNPDGNTIEIIPDRSVGISVAWADVPQNIKDGLTAINDYMHNEALKKEGMNDE